MLEMREFGMFRMFLVLSCIDDRFWKFLEHLLIYPYIAEFDFTAARLFYVALRIRITI